MSTPEELAYAESVRALEHQARVLDDLRSRTGILLAGASIVASFLGAEALKGSDGDALGGLGLLAFLGVLALSFRILWPRREWRFALGAKVLLEDWADTTRPGSPMAMQRFLAETIERNWDSNERELNRMFVLFQFTAGALGAEVLLWTLKLA